MFMIALLLNIPDKIGALALPVASGPGEVIIHKTLAIESAALRIYLCQIGEIRCQDEISLLILRDEPGLKNTRQRVSPVAEKTNLLLESHRLAVEAIEVGSADM